MTTTPPDLDLDTPIPFRLTPRAEELIAARLAAEPTLLGDICSSALVQLWRDAMNRCVTPYVRAQQLRLVARRLRRSAPTPDVHGARQYAEQLVAAAELLETSPSCSGVSS